MKLGLERLARAEVIFNAAIERPAGEQAELIARLCGGDQDLLDFVRDLLHSDESGGGEAVSALVARSKQEAERAAPGRDDSHVPTRIGSYSIQGVLGQGGMGVVYKAVRDDDFEKVVAIKVVKRGMDTGAVLERFRQERQILASFDHPNIARLLDGGQTDDGRPYLVMDYVSGTELMDFIRERRPSIEQKLRLFLAICRAVEYAHRRLVVHRDLKPSNIRVNEKDEPVLLDFGIAKLLDADARMTQTGFPAMTPQYAAPEQVRGEPITVAADVYTLGLLLYEMLSGAKAHRIASMSGPEVFRAVCVDDAPSLATTAPGLPRDLDAIVSMALRKEPSRRYPSAGRIAEDVEHFLKGEPVNARAGSRAYKTGKFLRRHWRAALAVSLVLVTIAGSSLALLRFARQAERERQKAEQVSSFLTSIFRVSTPSEAKGNTVTAREILDAGAERIGKDTTLAPEVKVDIMETVALVYYSLGLFHRSTEVLEASLGLRRQLGVEADIAATIGALGSVRSEMGDYKAASDLLKESLAIQLRVRPNDPDVGRVENDLGVLLYHLDDCEESQRLLRDALRFVENGVGAERSTVKNNLGLCSMRLSKYDEAIALYSEARTLDEKAAGKGDIGVANALTNLGFALAQKARYPEAEPLLRESVAIRKRVLPPTHSELARSYSNLARVLLEVGDLPGAAEAQKETRIIRDALSHSPLVVTDDFVDGSLHLALGDWRAARKSLTDAVDRGRTLLGADHHDTLQAMSALGVALDRLNQRAEAERLQGEVLDAALRRYGPRHSLVGLAGARMAALRLEANQIQEALSLGRQAVEVLSEAHGRDHPKVADALMVEGAALSAAGRKDDARQAFAEALRIRATKLRPGNPAIREAEMAGGSGRKTEKPSALPSGAGGAHGT
ncbi:MAG: serine/threonine-protein kinase [Vicinamibacteria bacterium]|nr:serine/threonine-protein kinase [Vicinamibacteria bacterium]